MPRIVYIYIQLKRHIVAHNIHTASLAEIRATQSTVPVLVLVRTLFNRSNFNPKPHVEVNRDGFWWRERWRRQFCCSQSLAVVEPIRKDSSSSGSCGINVAGKHSNQHEVLLVISCLAMSLDIPKWGLHGSFEHSTSVGPLHGTFYVFFLYSSAAVVQLVSFRSFLSVYRCPFPGSFFR